MSPSLTNLPYEILWYIVAELNIDDVVSLARTCKFLRYLETDPSICKKIIERRFPFGADLPALAAKNLDYASLFRRISKTREAIASNRPYSVAIVGFGDTFLYSQGVLCYTIDDKIRILYLSHSHDYEIVIGIPHLIEEAIFGTNSRVAGTFVLLYYSNDILSCLYKLSAPSSGAWLLAVDVMKQEILLSTALDTTEKIFVRHNSLYLYYGTHSETSPDGYKEWILRGYEFQTETWFENSVYLRDLIGADIGSTICFEILNGYFYAVSNQTTYEVEEVDWTSFYHCIRFPLDSPSKESLERTEDHDMWRRQHLEGPLDDRWTCLRLQLDYATGNVRIVEIRKEWLNGGSIGQRTCYTTDITFARRSNASDFDLPIPLSSSESLSSHSLMISATQLATLPSSIQTFAALTQDRLALTLTPNDKPHFLPPQTRLPRNVHREVTGPGPAMSLYKTQVKYYNSVASSFMDLFVDSRESDFQIIPCLRLRSCSRRLEPPKRSHTGLWLPERRDSKSGIAIPGLNETFTSSSPQLWPPRDNLNDSLDPDLADLYRLLYPPTHSGAVEGIADESSVVYCTGNRDQPKAIIFVNFDPGVGLLGLKDWSGDKDVAGLQVQGVRMTDNNELQQSENLTEPGVVLETEQEEDHQTVIDALGTPYRENLWMRREPAMYRAIRRGYNFGLPHRR